MRLPESHPLLMALLKKFDLPRQEFYLVDVDPDDPARKTNRTWIHVNGLHERRADYEKNPERVNDTFKVTGENRKKTAAAILADALEPVHRLIRGKEGTALVDGWAEVLEKYGHWSMYRYLTEVAGLDTRTIYLVGTIQNLTSRLHLSFLHSFLSSALIDPRTKFWEIKGGTAQVFEGGEAIITVPFYGRQRRRHRARLLQLVRRRPQVGRLRRRGTLSVCPRRVQAVFGRRCEVFFTAKCQTQSWMRDHYAYGEASVLLPGQHTELFPDIPTSEGPLHFAGDHTSIKPAWIEGALESAVRSAMKVHTG
ncbi:FAD-dependent oxidoreductase [Streptomyces sp. NPDC003781]|uniref:FAD-dependent oxidoreductase n=1 Tax=Streptomyces sp. NPDC003781 TaxID=3364686 RepID=UPI00369FE37F